MLVLMLLIVVRMLRLMVTWLWLRAADAADDVDVNVVDDVV